MASRTITALPEAMGASMVTTFRMSTGQPSDAPGLLGQPSAADSSTRPASLEKRYRGLKGSISPIRGLRHR